jgi:hypothetical protein
MMKKIVLLVLLVTVTMGTAFAAKKQKLGEAAAKQLLEKMNKSGVSSKDVEDAIKIINKYAKDAKSGTGLGFSWPDGLAKDVKSKKVKQLFQLIDAGAGIIDKVSTIATAWDLAWRYNLYDSEKAASLKKLANLQFDTLDFAAGFFVGGSYYKAGIAAGKAIYAMISEHYGDIIWTNIQVNGAGSALNANKILTDYPGSMYSYWQDPDYYEFARAWFCAAYDPKNTDGQNRNILMNIGEYIWALRTLQNAGLL